MIVKLAIMALGIINTTTRRITRRFMNNNNSNGLNIIIIINQPQLQSNRLVLLEKNLTMVSIEIPFLVVSVTIHHFLKIVIVKIKFNYYYYNISTQFLT